MVVAGCVAAALLVLKGQAQAVPALAVGAALGSVAMLRRDRVVRSLSRR